MLLPSLPQWIVAAAIIVLLVVPLVIAWRRDKNDPFDFEGPDLRDSLIRRP